MRCNDGCRNWNLSTGSGDIEVVTMAVKDEGAESIDIGLTKTLQLSGVAIKG